MNLVAPARCQRELDSGWCPGCGHGIANRLYAEVLTEMGIADKAIMVHDVACGSLGALGTYQFDAIVAAHGRPIPTTVGVKLARPDSVAIAYFGDGAAYSIGAAEVVHAALRNNNITVFVVNNTVYGMTGGQMAPTTIPGEKTMSSIYGKDPKKYGTLDICKLLDNMNIAFLGRSELYDVPAIANTKKLMQECIQNQLDGKGFSLLEILAPCPTNLHMTPLDTKEWVHTEVTKYLPLGITIRDGQKVSEENKVEVQA